MRSPSFTALGAAVVLAASPAEAQDDRRELTLHAALAMARTRSPDVLEARARADAAQAEASVALAGYLPRADAQGAANQTWSRAPVLAPDGTAPVQPGWSRSLDATGTLRWTAFDFGQTPNAVSAARSDARAAGLRARGATNVAVAAVAGAFLTAAFDDLLVENAQTTVRIRDRHAALSRGLVVSGLRPTVDEARARVELELARLELTNAERQRAHDRVRLAALLRLPDPRGIDLVRPSLLPTVTEDPVRSATQAERRRPEIGAASEEVDARESALDASRAARLPTIGASLEGTYRHTLTDRDAGYVPTSSLAALATINVPIFDWHVWGRIEVARSEVAAAEARRSGAVARVRGEAADASFGVHAARIAVQQARGARDISGASLVVMEGRFQSGLATTTDLFDAATQDAEARRASIRADLALALATVDALAAQGRLDELDARQGGTR